MILDPRIKIGDKVRKLARRNHRGSTALGTVIELFEKEGRVWARVASGERQTITTAWPVLKLRVVVPEEGSDGLR